MKLLADENVDRAIVMRLRQEGHIVAYVAEMAPGITDDEVLDLANQEGAILLTGDKDFGELVARQQRQVPGVVLMRLEGLSPGDKANLVAHVLAQRSAELPGAFTVISPRTIRVRRPRP